MIFKSTLSCLALAITASGLFQIAAAADGPTPFPDAKDEAAWPGKGPIRVFDWMIQNRAYFWTRREKDQGAVVFVGDSLTANWKGLAAEFPELKIANRGIGGDGSRGVLFRFKEDVIDLKPKAMVLCIGSNDLSAHANPAHIDENIQAILKQAREYSATMPIILCTLPPRDKPDAATKPGAYDDINGRIRKMGKPGKDFEVLDLWALYAGPDGKPAVLENFDADKLHLAAPGYKVWGAALKPIFERMGIK